jgi:biotin carboxylase
MKALLLAFQYPKIPYVFDACARLGVSVFAIFEPQHETDAERLLASGQISAFELAKWEAVCAPASRMLDEFALAWNVDGALTLDEATVPAVAACAARLGFAGPGVESVLRARSKRLRSETLAPHELSPRQQFLPLDTARSTGPAALEAMGFDAIMKPASGYSSTGVARVRSVEEFHGGMDVIDSLHAGALGSESLVDAGAQMQDLAGVVLEEFVNGPEFAVEVVADASTAVAVSWGSKGAATGPHFHEAPYIAPGSNDLAVRERVLGAAETAVLELGLRNTVAHVELRLDSSGAPKVIDLGPRCGGSGVVDWLSRRSFGVSVCESAVRLALGMELRLGTHACRATDPAIVTANYVVPAEGPGVFRSVDNLDAALAADTAEFVPLMSSGTELPAWPVWAGYVGFVLSEHDSRSEAEAFHRLLDESLIIRRDDRGA